MNITIRKATGADKEFLIDSIIEAEKSGGNIISYCAIFSITEAELRQMLHNILDEGIEGQELCIANFLIAEADETYAAACSSWIEKADGIASNIIKSNLLMYFLDREKLFNAAPSLSLMNDVNIERTGNTLQVESVYTHSTYRGQGLSAQLINAQIQAHYLSAVPFSKVQIQLLKNNQGAIKAYEKAGFSTVRERKTDNKAILQLLPCDTKILMEREINY